MPPKHIPPATSLKSFSCPSCGALADQDWFETGAVSIAEKPNVFKLDRVDELAKDRTFLPEYEPERRQELFLEWRRFAKGGIFLNELSEWKNYKRELANVHVSSCYSCKEIALWKYDTLLFPREKYNVEPNADLNEDIRRDFDEAREVLDISPRSAAALLRLCLQKLCIQLGFPGKNINDDIREMVKNGLNPKIQKALDIVRVVGNEAVHPDTMDLRDDRETAIKLFGLVNHIAFEMVTHPKEIEALYSSLPPEKLAGIVKRDTKN